MRNPILDLVEKKNIRADAPSFRPGDVVRVHWKIREGGKERVQAFEGLVIRKTRRHNRSTFTVRTAGLVGSAMPPMLVLTVNPSA